MKYIGIDPGLAGGIGIIGDNSVEAYTYTPSNLINIIKSLNDEEDVLFFVELVHAMPKQGVTSTFNFGKGFGIILGILEAFNMRYSLVRPQTWKSNIGVTADKKTSVRKAQLLFPDTSLLPTPRCRVPSDGLAEALLIAEYGRRVSGNRSKENVK